MTIDLMDPVRDMQGIPVWRIRVAPGELTCLSCGETTNDAYCARCDSMQGQIGHNKPGAPHAQLVPTISYLHPEEYDQP